LIYSLELDPLVFPLIGGKILKVLAGFAWVPEYYRPFRGDPALAGEGSPDISKIN
jgi:hypothetical protein